MHRVAAMATSPTPAPTALQKHRNHARIGLGPNPESQTYGEIEKMQHVVLRQRCLEPPA
jgi:hypothetical protein